MCVMHNIATSILRRNYEYSRLQNSALRRWTFISLNRKNGTQKIKSGCNVYIIQSALKLCPHQRETMPSKISLWKSFRNFSEEKFLVEMKWFYLLIQIRRPSIWITCCWFYWSCNFFTLDSSLVVLVGKLTLWIIYIKQKST